MSDAIQSVTADVSGNAPETRVTDGGRSHADRIKWIHSFTTAASAWLTRSMRDDDYYHSIQWTADEKSILRNRQPAGQPVVTINRIQPKVNHILGVRQRFRMSPAGLPRSPNHEDDGDAFSDIMSFLVDSVKFAEAEDAANEDIGKVGYGGYILGLRAVEELIISPPAIPQAGSPAR